MQNGGGVVGRQGVDMGAGAPAVRAGLVSRQERGGGGGDGRGGSPDPLGLACTAPLAAAGDGGRLGVGVARRRAQSGGRKLGRRLARRGGLLGRLGWGPYCRCLGGCLGGIGGVTDSNEALRLGFVTISSSQMKSPPLLTKGRE